MLNFRIIAADHTGITVSNLERSLAFYGTALGLHPSPGYDPQGYVPVMANDGRTVYLVQSARSVRGGLAFTF